MTDQCRPDTTGLDPDRDARTFMVALSCWDFPWDIEKALEFALFRTYAVPEISGLLSRTGEFEKRTRKRYDDTELILAEIVQHGADHPRGAEALGRMNDMHSRYRIPNEQYLYVLSTFVFEPIRWIERFGWRKLTEAEKSALFYYYRDLGLRMGIADIPEDIHRFESFNQDFEAKHFRYAESNARIGNKSLDLLLGFYVPRASFAMFRRGAYALMDPPLLVAMGFPAPPVLLRQAVFGALRLRAAVLARLPKRRYPRLLTRDRRPSYPNGYAIADLGTFRPGAKSIPDKTNI